MYSKTFLFFVTLAGLKIIVHYTGNFIIKGFHYWGVFKFVILGSTVNHKCGYFGSIFGHHPQDEGSSSNCFPVLSSFWYDTKIPLIAALGVYLSSLNSTGLTSKEFIPGLDLVSKKHTVEIRPLCLVNSTNENCFLKK